MQRYKCTDMFFDISPIHFMQLQKVINFPKSLNVELMVHPERSEEYSYLISDEYIKIISDVKKINYVNLH